MQVEGMSIIGRLITRMKRIKRSGQSLVEFAVLLPILLLMIAGLIEFGFMLNVYLDLIDSARETARFLANDDPVHAADGSFDPNPFGTPEPKGFYDRGFAMAYNTLHQAGQVDLDNTTDDVVISVFVVDDGAVSQRWPAHVGPYGTCSAGNGGDLGFMLYCHHPSDFDSDAMINSRLANLSNVPPDSAVVLVEIYYDYHMVIGLTWIQPFVPDPVTLHAYSIMPVPKAEPTPTPSPPP